MTASAIIIVSVSLAFGALAVGFLIAALANAGCFADRIEFTTHHYQNCERDVRVTLAWHGAVKSVDLVAERVFYRVR